MTAKSRYRIRNAKGKQHFSRRSAAREVYDRVLIVTEGKKTEPQYFQEIKNRYRINSAVIDGSGGSSPVSVVAHGKLLYNQERKDKNPFDRVYFVFDKDAHESYSRAINEVESLSPADTFFLSNSVPCFEYWLLLHYEDTTKPYQSTGGQSSSAAVIRDLKKHMPEYAKGKHGVFESLFGLLENAKENAARALVEANRTGTDNPSTRVHELVDYLQNIKP